MINILEFAIEVTIAIVALIIAILQWKEERRISKEEKTENSLRIQEKLVVNEIANQIDEIEKCSDYIFEFMAQMDGLSKKQDSDPSVVMGIFDNLIEQYTQNFKNKRIL